MYSAQDMCHRAIAREQNISPDGRSLRSYSKKASIEAFFWHLMLSLEAIFSTGSFCPAGFKPTRPASKHYQSKKIIPATQSRTNKNPQAAAIIP